MCRDHELDKPGTLAERLRQQGEARERARTLKILAEVDDVDPNLIDYLRQQIERGEE